MIKDKKVTVHSSFLLAPPIPIKKFISTRRVDRVLSFFSSSSNWDSRNICTLWVYSTSRREEIRYPECGPCLSVRAWVPPDLCGGRRKGEETAGEQAPGPTKPSLILLRIGYYKNKVICLKKLYIVMNYFCVQ